MKTTNY
jgi:hypothetical protein